MRTADLKARIRRLERGGVRPAAPIVLVRHEGDEPFPCEGRERPGSIVLVRPLPLDDYPPR